MAGDPFGLTPLTESAPGTTNGAPSALTSNAAPPATLIFVVPEMELRRAHGKGALPRIFSWRRSIGGRAEDEERPIAVFGQGLIPWRSSSMSCSAAVAVPPTPLLATLSPWRCPFTSVVVPVSTMI